MTESGRFFVACTTSKGHDMSCPFLAEVFYSIENRDYDLAVVHIHLRIVKKQDKDSLTLLTARENLPGCITHLMQLAAA